MQANEIEVSTDMSDATQCLLQNMVQLTSSSGVGQLQCEVFKSKAHQLLDVIFEDENFIGSYDAQCYALSSQLEYILFKSKMPFVAMSQKQQVFSLAICYLLYGLIGMCSSHCWQEQDQQMHFTLNLNTRLQDVLHQGKKLFGSTHPLVLFFTVVQRYITQRPKSMMNAVAMFQGVMSVTESNPLADFMAQHRCFADLLVPNSHWNQRDLKLSQLRTLYYVNRGKRIQATYSVVMDEVSLQAHGAGFFKHIVDVSFKQGFIMHFHITTPSIVKEEYLQPLIEMAQLYDRGLLITTSTKALVEQLDELFLRQIQEIAPYAIVRLEANKVYRNGGIFRYITQQRTEKVSLAGQAVHGFVGLFPHIQKKFQINYLSYHQSLKRYFLYIQRMHSRASAHEGALYHNFIRQTLQPEKLGVKFSEHKVDDLYFPCECANEEEMSLSNELISSQLYYNLPQTHSYRVKPNTQYALSVKIANIVARCIKVRVLFIGIKNPEVQAKHMGLDYSHTLKAPYVDIRFDEVKNFKTPQGITRIKVGALMLGIAVASLEAMHIEPVNTLEIA